MTESTNEIYIPENVPLFEAIYGEGLISLGGYPAVDKMFRGKDLTNKHLLDIGSGIGGIPKYLAEKYDSWVTGLEVHQWMTEYATTHRKASIKHQVDFITYDEGGRIPLPPNCIDLVYSKGVLTNVADKASLFTEIHRILKSESEICLIDWLVPESDSPSEQQLQTGEPSYKETPSTYREILESQGFTDVVFEDVSHEYLEYVLKHQDVLSSDEHKEKYRDILNEELRGILLKSNQELMDTIQSGNQLSMRIMARIKEKF